VIGMRRERARERFFRESHRLGLPHPQPLPARGRGAIVALMRVNTDVVPEIREIIGSRVPTRTA